MNQQVVTLKQLTTILGTQSMEFSHLLLIFMFREVFAHIHDLDPTRPVTVINFNGRHDNQGGEYIDVIGFNFYTGWYQDTGELDVVVTNLVAEGQRLRGIYNKPVMVTEYGSDTQEGLHIVIWTTAISSF